MVVEMFSINGKKSSARVMWRDYVKSVQNLERYIINFFYWVRNLGKLDNYVQYSRNKIEVKWVWLFGVLKYISRLVVRLKTIKYNENSFCYLSSYSPNLGLQAPYFLILFFWPYAFRTLYPWQNVFIYLNFRSQIYSNNLNLYLLSLLLI